MQGLRFLVMVLINLSAHYIQLSSLVHQLAQEHGPELANLFSLTASSDLPHWSATPTAYSIDSRILSWICLICSGDEVWLVMK
jgi:hypothetical protein